MPDNKFDLEQFLTNIAEIESSGGKNINHREIASGMHSGDSAIGKYGMMPNTVEELQNRNTLEGKLNPELAEISGQPHDQMKQSLENNPELQEQLAKELALKLQHSYGGDQDKMAYGWNQGHNTPEEKMTPEELNNSDYVGKFRRLNDVYKTKQLLDNASQMPLESSMGDLKMKEQDDE